ncbi:hypothetical protein NQ314_007140 [Rhamnusium bicolor]|uniref:PiggyBac transposable element-derived protein domain-containing protein n=1 Tax=Rhamnusium bicolor TaxID=1586634 RepID=A0AAV8YUC9_9CUCU|nr:hypothetical protein NQ314_007140 [Rhamnusium bicolor]
MTHLEFRHHTAKLHRNQLEHFTVFETGATIDIIKLLEEVLSDKDGEIQYDDQSDDDVSDREELEIHETDSEQEISDVGEDDIYNNTSLSYIGNDNVTYWKKHPPVTKAVKTRSENLIKRLPGSSMATSSYDVVTRLCPHIVDTGRNVTIDNWFTSLSLVKTLLSDFKLTVIGTIRKNKRKLPVEFSKPVFRPEKSSMFGFRNECTLVSYIPKKGKNVRLVSSLHHSDDINNETGDLQKPEMVTEYNKTREELADNLIRPYLQRRVSLINIPRSLQIRLKEVCGIEKDNQENVIPGRCGYGGWK